MYFIEDFCRICLKKEPQLKNVTDKSPDSVILLDKLNLVVPEVTWTEFEEFLFCDACIKNLNSAYDFKKQCFQSSGTLKKYLHTLTRHLSGRKERKKCSVRLDKKSVSPRRIADYLKCEADKKAKMIPPLVMRPPFPGGMQGQGTGNMLRPQIVSVLPEQSKLIAQAPRLVLPGQSNTTFPNLFLNFVPMNMPRPTITVTQTAENKLPPAPNNTFYMIYQNQQPTMNNVPRLHVPNAQNPEILKNPIAGNSRIQSQTTSQLNALLNEPPAMIPKPHAFPTKDISEVLVENQSEELSVDINPLDFTLSEDEDGAKDEEIDKVIETTDILNDGNKNFPSQNSKLHRLLDKGIKTKQKADNLWKGSNLNPPPLVPTNSKSFGKTFFPPPVFNKPIENINQPINNFPSPPTHSDFFHSGHFLFQENNWKEPSKLLQCEVCLNQFETLKSLKCHFRAKHSGGFPYSCWECNEEFVLREHYDEHIKNHFKKVNGIITLEDLEREKLISEKPEEEVKEEKIKPFKCPDCHLSFTANQGLNRHRTRRHNPDAKAAPKRYFVKGSKNAFCKVCKRKFSTQSYLMIHLKGHLEKGECDKSEVELLEQQLVKTKEKNATAVEVIAVNDDVEIIGSDEEENQEDEDNEEEMDVEELTEDKEMEEDSDAEEMLLAPQVEINEEKETSEMGNETGTKNPSLKIKINLKEIKESERRRELENESEESLPKQDNDDSTTMDGMKEGSDDFYGTDNAVYSDNPGSFLPDVSENEDGSQYLNETEQFGEGEQSFEGGGEGVTCAEDGNQSTINLMDIELVEGKPQCSFCKKLFGRRHDLKRHINNVHLKFIVYNCHVCHRKFYEGFHLTRHLRGHFSFVTCGTCLKPFCAVGELKNHISAIHNSFSPFNCGVCNDPYDNFDELKLHMDEHDKTIVYQCHLCPMILSECRELTKHLIEHSGMYTCLQCKIPFASEQDLTIHIKTHDKQEAPRYECEICHNTYKKRRYLVIHQSNAHGIKKAEISNKAPVDPIVTEDSS